MADHEGENARLSVTDQRRIRMRLWSMLSDLATEIGDEEREAEAKTLSVALAANLGPVIEQIITDRDERIRALRGALRDAIETLIEDRDFIAVETRHYPTIRSINAKVEQLTEVLNG